MLCDVVVSGVDAMSDLAHGLRCQDHSPATTQVMARHSLPPLLSLKGSQPSNHSCEYGVMMLKQVYSLEGLVSAKCVQRLDDSQIVQIALRFAFHCVLHRCKSLEIHC